MPLFVDVLGFLDGELAPQQEDDTLLLFVDDAVSHAISIIECQLVWS